MCFNEALSKVNEQNLDAIHTFHVQQTKNTHLWKNESHQKGFYSLLLELFIVFTV